MTTLMDARAREAIRGLTRYTPGTAIEEAKRRLPRKTVIKLASNENAAGPSPKALAALRRATATLHRYPESGCPLLREALAKKLKVAPGQLIFGNGSDELIVLALRAFVDAGDEVVLARPTFLIYELQARACGATVTVVPLKDYRYDLPAMAAAVTPHTKLVFIANPDNPTGTYVTAKELKTFLGRIPDQAIVFMDEAYYEFVSAADYPQTLSLRAEQSLIIARSFSKAYGLAGARIGYGIAPEGVVAAMEAVREPFNVNSLAQAAALGALRDAVYLARSRRQLREGMRYLTTQLARLKVRYVPSVTNFLLLELGPRAGQVAQQLLARGIIVRELSAWKLAGCLRVTVGTPVENRAFIRALQQCLR